MVTALRRSRHAPGGRWTRRDFWLEDRDESDAARGRAERSRSRRRRRPDADVVDADRPGNIRGRRRAAQACGRRSRRSCWPHWPGPSRPRSATVRPPSTSAEPGRSVLKPDVDLRRTVGWFTTVYPVALTVCHRRDTSARQLLDDVQRHAESRPALRNRVRAVAVFVRANRAAARRPGPADIFFSLCRHDPRPAVRAIDDAPVQFDTDTATAGARDAARAWVTPSNCGCIAPRRAASGLVV